MSKDQLATHQLHLQQWALSLTRPFVLSRARRHIEKSVTASQQISRRQSTEWMVKIARLSYRDGTSAGCCHFYIHPSVLDAAGGILGRIKHEMVFPLRSLQQWASVSGYEEFESRSTTCWATRTQHTGYGGSENRCPPSFFPLKMTLPSHPISQGVASKTANGKRRGMSARGPEDAIVVMPCPFIPGILSEFLKGPSYRVYGEVGCGK